MHINTLPSQTLTDAEFRVRWIAGFSVVVIAQAAGCTASAVYSRAQRLGFVTPIMAVDESREVA